MPNPFVFVPRCVPVDLFEQYLRVIASKFPGRRIVVFESNPANLHRYEANVSALPYQGKRFVAEPMLAQVQGKVEWGACDAILVPLTANTTKGFEQLVQFAGRTAAAAPIYLLTPDNTFTEVTRSKPSDAGDNSGETGEPKVSLDALSESALLGKIGGSPNRSYRYRDGSVYVFGWLDDGGRFGADELSVYLGDEATTPTSAFILRCTHPDPAVAIRAEYPGIAIFIPRIKKSVTAVRICYPGGGETRFPIETNTEKFEDLLAEVGAHASLCRTMKTLSAAERDDVDVRFAGLMEDINARFIEGIKVVEDLLLGPAPQTPSVTLIIPIHKSYELIRHQFSHFAADDFLKRQEILLVLTSVSGGEEEVSKFKHLMRRIYELYAIPCRLLITNKNCSFSVANNLGAAAARGRYLMLLNSDAFPKAPGWLQTMSATLQSDPTIGIVGARLLYPDGSVQHVAMDWRREPACDNLLVNIHPYKGIHPSLVPEQGVAEVAAVTAACMLLRRDEYMRLGMLDTGFIRGDCEDSDFCLRVSAAGYRIVCDNTAVLYHLEGASYRPEARRLLFQYNTSRQEKRWGATISKRTRQQSGVEAAF